MEKKKPSYTVGGSVNWYRHNGKWYAGSSKTINRITIWSRNSIPGSRKKMKIIWKDTGTIMFITALFTTAKAWEQPKCPSGDDWLKTIWNTHTHTHTHTHTPHTHTHTHTRLPWWLTGTESTCQTGDSGLIPGSGREKTSERPWGIYYRD